jgi:crotonobetainyl-CoA:carnitine CoA-transferase CaiB-like acyl-CoA transferase
MTGFPVKLSETPHAVRQPVPDLGAQTGDVLAEAGYDPEEVTAPRAAGVVGRRGGITASARCR